MMWFLLSVMESNHRRDFHPLGKLTACCLNHSANEEYAGSENYDIPTPCLTNKRSNL